MSHDTAWCWVTKLCATSALHYMPHASIFVFTSLIGVTSSNTVSHHLVFASTNATSNTEIVTIYVFTSAGVTIFCHCCGQQLPARQEWPNFNNDFCFLSHRVRLMSASRNVFDDVPSARCVTRDCPPCRTMWETGARQFTSVLRSSSRCSASLGPHACKRASDSSASR